jgi:CO dehydrogenase maturation factor
MKIAVAGKGGVGKTLISANLARLLARDGYRVLAADADPNLNLATALGIKPEIADKIIPLSDNTSLIEEKTGIASDQTFGGIFNMTPRVNDIVERYGVDAPDGVKLLVMGTIKAGNSGCMCGANALLRVLIQHLVIQRKEAVIMDMEAGLEHFGRGTARQMDIMLVIVEPRMKSIDTVHRIIKLAKDVEIKNLVAVGNKINSPYEKQFIDEKMKQFGLYVAAYIPYDSSVVEADMRGVSLIDYDVNSIAMKEIKNLEKYLIEMSKN